MQVRASAVAVAAPAVVLVAEAAPAVVLVAEAAVYPFAIHDETLSRF